MRQPLSQTSNRVSLKKIAELLHTTECTVSKALHNKPKVSETMRQKVWKLAQELGYRPNSLARTMARNPTKVKIICPQAWPSYYHSLLAGVQKRGDELRDYRLETDITYYNDMSDILGCIKAVRLAREDHFDALILLSGTFDEAGSKALTGEVAECKCPVFLLGGGLVPAAHITSHIKQDSYKCGRIAGNLAELLLSGKGAAAVIVGRRTLLDHQMKYEGFRDCLSSNSIPLSGVAESLDQDGMAYKAAMDLFRGDPNISLLYVATENIDGVLIYLQKFHLKHKVKIIATGTSDSVVQALNNGLIQFTIDENTLLQGRKCMDAVFQTVILNQPVQAQIMVTPVIKIKDSL